MFYSGLFLPELFSYALVYGSLECKDDAGRGLELVPQGACSQSSLLFRSGQAETSVSCST